jgi:hypothetical protein
LLCGSILGFKYKKGNDYEIVAYIMILILELLPVQLIALE